MMKRMHGEPFRTTVVDDNGCQQLGKANLLGLVQLVVGFVELLCVLVAQFLDDGLVVVNLFVHHSLQLGHFLLTLASQLLGGGSCVERVFQLALQSLQLLSQRPPNLLD